MKRFFLILAAVMLLVPTYTWAKGGSYTRKAPIPILASMVTPASLSGKDIEGQASGDCGGLCRNRSFRRAKASFQ
jgi:hypothetical protein